MGFTPYEKLQLKTVIREESKDQLDQFPEYIVKFIKSNGLINQIGDYGRFPSMRHKQQKAENIELHLRVDNDFDLDKILQEFKEIIAPPYQISIDFSFLIKNSEGKNKTIIIQWNKIDF